MYWAFKYGPRARLRGSELILDYRRGSLWRGYARRLSASLDVIIEVVDGEDAGAVVLSQRQPEVGIAVHATASDDDGGVTIRKWVWEVVRRG